MRKLLLLISTVMMHALVLAQDIHFSQFDHSPLLLNPALTGAYDGRLRVVGNQRTQWRSVTVPYSTFGVGADWADVAEKGFSGGLSFYNDKTGDSQLTTQMLNVSVAKRVSVNDGQTRLSGGLTLGYTRMTIDYSQLKYDNQWNGLIYDAGLASSESFARDSRGYLHLHLGADMRHRLDDIQTVQFGFALFNLTSPKQSFFNDSFVRLDLRTQYYGSYARVLNEQWRIEPGFLYMRQGKFREFDLGSKAYYVLESKTWMYRTVYAGIYGRTKDAGFIVAGMQFDGWDVGLSYDINTSRLRPASQGRGGLEFSVIRIWAPRPKVKPGVKYCPNYI